LPFVFLIVSALFRVGFIVVICTKTFDVPQNVQIGGPRDRGARHYVVDGPHPTPTPWPDADVLVPFPGRCPEHHPVLTLVVRVPLTMHPLRYLIPNRSVLRWAGWHPGEATARRP